MLMIFMATGLYVQNSLHILVSARLEARILLHIYKEIFGIKVLFRLEFKEHSHLELYYFLCCNVDGISVK